MSGLRIHRTLGVGLLVLLIASCLRIGKGGMAVSASVPVPSSWLMDSTTIHYAPPNRAGMLTPEQFAAAGPLIRTLRAEPTTLSLVVGDTVRVADLVRIIAVDSAGMVLGEIPYYDFAYTGRGFRLLQDGRVSVNRKGTVVYSATLPERYWQGSRSGRLSVKVALVVID